MEIILAPGRSEKNYWRDLWRYRELFRVLAWRDISVRYKQTAFGVAWAVIRPLLTLVILTVVFGRIAGLPSEAGAPYALLVAAGMLPWTLFSTALSDAASSLTSNSNLIGKVYFPRLIIPSATIVVAFVDLMVNFAVLAAMMLWFRFPPGLHLLLLPAFLCMAVLAVLGPSLWITALNLKYRDFRYIIPFVAQFGLYVSPVGFSSSVVPERWRLLYALNPMVAVIDGFRWCLLGGARPLDPRVLVVGVAVVGLLLWTGVRQFRRMERTFADLI